MASADFQRAQRTETLALVRSLEQASLHPAALDAYWVQAALERVGDVLRLEDPAPCELLRMLSNRERQLLADAIALTRAELATWVLPASRETALELDGFAFTLRRRDELHSLIVGLTRLALSRGHTLDVFEAYPKLASEVADFDGALRAVCSRQSAEELLGTRITLQACSTWLHVLADEETPTAENSMLSSGAPLVRPSATDIEAYASVGALRAYVEGFARRDADFCVELCEAIDTLRSLDESVSFVARLFRRKAGPARETAPDFQFALDTRLAAASDELEAREQRIQLGPLPEVAAHASLVLRGDMLEFNVYAEAPLALVQIAEVQAHAPAEIHDGVAIWRVRTPVSAGTHSLRAIVRDAAGRLVDEQFTVEIA